MARSKRTDTAPESTTGTAQDAASTVVSSDSTTSVVSGLFPGLSFEESAAQVKADKEALTAAQAARRADMKARHSAELKGLDSLDKSEVSGLADKHAGFTAYVKEVLAATSRAPARLAAASGGAPKAPKADADLCERVHAFLLEQGTGMQGEKIRLGLGMAAEGDAAKVRDCLTALRSTGRVESSGKGRGVLWTARAVSAVA